MSTWREEGERKGEREGAGIRGQSKSKKARERERNKHPLLYFFIGISALHLTKKSMLTYIFNRFIICMSTCMTLRVPDPSWF